MKRCNVGNGKSHSVLRVLKEAWQWEGRACRMCLWKTRVSVPVIHVLFSYHIYSMYVYTFICVSEDNWGYNTLILLLYWNQLIYWSNCSHICFSTKTHRPAFPTLLQITFSLNLVTWTQEAHVLRRRVCKIYFKALQQDFYLFWCCDPKKKHH